MKHRFGFFTLAAAGLAFVLAAGLLGGTAMAGSKPPNKGTNKGADVSTLTSAAAQTVASPVKAAQDPVHDVIEKQLRAFRERDARSAYMLASAKLQDKYGDERRFLTMMRILYRPLYENLSYKFLKRTTLDGALIQKVEIIDPEGSPTTVLYRLIKNEGGAWVVDSYTLLNSEAQPT